MNLGLSALLSGAMAQPIPPDAGAPASPAAREITREVQAIEASSTQDAYQIGDAIYTFPARNLLDGDPGRCWQEGAVGGGEGETLTLRLRAPARITALAVATGCQRVDAAGDHFSTNGRVLSIELAADGARRRSPT